MDVFLNQLFVGLSIASILLLVALGLTFTFGQMNVINMAHGEFIMAGAYTTYVLQTALGTGAIGLAFGLALPAAFLVAGTLGLILEFLVIRRLYGRPLDTLLVTWGVGLMLQQLARDLFGAQNVNVDAPGFLDGGITIAGADLSYPRLFIITVVALVVIAIAIYMVRTPAGRRMRAVMQNRPLAAVSGVRTTRVDRTTFFIGSGLAGLAGVGITLLGPGRPDARPRLHHRRLPRRHRRRPRPAARGDHRRARARHGELVHRVQHVDEHRQGGRLPAHRAVPAVAARGHRRAEAPGARLMAAIARAPAAQHAHAVGLRSCASRSWPSRCC